jgi:probable rRNA maturation factor
MLEVEIIIGDDISVVFPLEERRLGAYAHDVLAGNGVECGECTIVFIGDSFMTELNEKYKGRTGTTDVLSFDLTDDLTGMFCGEVYISLLRAKAQAEEQGVPFKEEVVRLVTHGLLHLAGFVHDTESSDAAMTVKTEELVKAFFRPTMFPFSWKERGLGGEF